MVLLEFYEWVHSLCAGSVHGFIIVQCLNIGLMDIKRLIFDYEVVHLTQKVIFDGGILVVAILRLMQTGRIWMMIFYQGVTHPY